ncbi:MAG: DUF1838 domain-containing protein [Gammaproteobacteria bacterium]|nr:DUF1838 domain-containing protein [Gammaproteobacteria bacterium]
MSEINRRTALELGAMMATGIPLNALANDTVVAGPDTTGINFDDPEATFRARIKVLGSLADEEIYRLSTGHIYGFVPGRQVFALMNIENYSVSRTHKLDNGNYQAHMWEVGVWTDRVTGEPLKTFNNPVTDRVVDVLPYAVGPLQLTITPGGILIPGTENTVHPQALQPRVFDGHIWYPFESAVNLPNPLPEDDWPEASSGEIFSWHSVIVFSALLADIADKKTSWAPAQSQYSEFTSWQPWLQMGHTPGGMMWRGYGKKFGPEAKIPRDIRKKIEQTIPEIFDRDNWTRLRNEFIDYKSHYGDAVGGNSTR